MIWGTLAWANLRASRRITIAAATAAGPANASRSDASLVVTGSVSAIAAISVASILSLSALSRWASSAVPSVWRHV